MNEYAVASALKALISDNEATLLSGLTLDGVAKVIGQLTSSVLTPPELYYFVAIDVQSATAHYQMRPMPKNLRHTTKQTAGMLIDEYEASIYVVDYALKSMPIEGEVQSFEEEHQLFRQLTDRIVDLLDRTDQLTSGTYTMWIPGEGGDEDRRIGKENRLDAWEDSDGQHFELGSRITFRVKACSDSSI